MSTDLTVIRSTRGRVAAAVACLALVVAAVTL